MTYPLTYRYASENQLLVEVSAGDASTLWTCATTNRSAWSEILRKYADVELAVKVIDVTTLKDRIATAYSSDQSNDRDAAAIVSEVESVADLSKMIQDLPPVEDLLESNDDAPIIRMLNALLMQAAREQASDIHIEPYDRYSCVRLRIDGTLRELVRPNRALHAALISRLKVMAELDISEKRLPQDGRISVRLGSRSVDVRVSTLPCAHGERAVLRLLDKSAVNLQLESIGMSGSLLLQVSDVLKQPNGLFLVTGPTGSGKTTTLYAALKRLNAQQVNIMTVEDPVEYELPGIGQTQVNSKIDLTFSSALRSILRQDPDVIMIGEIRDSETARIAVQASLTGHLVIATLHTNDAPSAVTRLTDMGVEPYLLSSSLLGVLGQRLVRKICLACQGAGCVSCGHSGYLGRIGVFEMMRVNERIRQLIHDGAAEADLRDAAIDALMLPMRAYGQSLVDDGITTHEELLRVTKD